MYRPLLQDDPVHWSDPLGAWVLTRYDDVDGALRDPRLLSSLGNIVPEPLSDDDGGWKVMQSLYAFVNNSMVFTDPPRHARLRDLVVRAFTPRSVEALRPRIAQHVGTILDAAAGRGELDLVRELAYPVPISAIAMLLGIPSVDIERLKEWCDDLLLPFGRDPRSMTADERRRAQQGGDAIAAYVRELIAKVRSNPGDDLLSALVNTASEGGERLTEDELFANVVLFLIAGHENLTSLLSVGTLTLLRNEDELHDLRKDRTLMAPAVEELLRYVTPNQFIRRHAGEDLQIGGRRIRRGEFVLLVLAAANRDPAKFIDPDELDLSRSPNRHLALGHGFHYCIGGALARLQAEVVWNAMLDRFSTIGLADTRLEYVENFNVHQLKSLRLSVS